MDPRVLASEGARLNLGYLPGFANDPVATVRQGLLLQQAGWEIVDTIVWTDVDDVTMVHGFMARSADGTILQANICGTVTLIEWAEDGWALKVLWPYSGSVVIKVHKGMFDCYQTLRTGSGLRVADALRAFDGRIEVQGHSLGAALAGLVTLELLGALGQSVLWACPRFTDPAGAAAIDSLGAMVLRLVNRPDAVPCLPPEKIFEILEYLHGGVFYPLDSTENACKTLGCAHHLQTYCHELDQGASLSPECVVPIIHT